MTFMWITYKYIAVCIFNNEATPKSLSSLIFNSFTPDLPDGGNSLKINELFMVPFRACPDESGGFRGF
jgi:hypothetical protein